MPVTCRPVRPRPVEPPRIGPRGTTPILVAADLHHSFGLRRVLRGIDLAVPPGDRVVLVGPNGAGKTTLLRILATLLRPERGDVAIAGLDSRRAAIEVRRRVGFASHQPSLYPDLTALENLRFFARLYRLDSAEERIGEALAGLGLYTRRNDRVRTYSRGMQQRLALARAVLHDPALLLLDEPDTGLDPRGLEMLEAMTAATAAVIVSTHDIRLGLTLADRVCVLLNGRIRLDEPAAAYTEARFRTRYAALLEETGWTARGWRGGAGSANGDGPAPGSWPRSTRPGRSS